MTGPTPGAGPIPLLPALRADLRAHLGAADLARPRPARFALTALAVVRSSGFHVTLLYRVAHASRARLGLPGKALGAVLFWLVRHVYGCSIASTARIGGGLILPHPQGIVVGGGSEVGPRAWIYQNVTIGGSPNRAGLPTVGSDARIYAGAVIAGPVRLGDGVIIGANAVVSRDLPAGSVARSPAVEVTTPPPAAMADAPPGPPES